MKSSDPKKIGGEGEEDDEEVEEKGDFKLV